MAFGAHAVFFPYSRPRDKKKKFFKNPKQSQTVVGVTQTFSLMSHGNRMSEVAISVQLQ